VRGSPFLEVPTVAKTEFLYALIYTGPKESKDAASALNSPVPMVFRAGDLSGQPGSLAGQKYCDVTEAQGRMLVKRFPELYRWPEGGTPQGPQAVTRDEYLALLARVEALEGTSARKLKAVS